MTVHSNVPYPKLPWHVALPLALLMASLAAAVAVNYGASGRGWVVAYYPFSAHAAVLNSAPHVEAIAAVSPDGRAATVYVPQASQRRSLRQSGALLLAPEGLPLCAKP